MTGWRLGWMVLPEDLSRPVERLQQNMFINAPTPSQLAAVEAFRSDDELQANVERYAANRAIMLREMPRAGFHKMAPSDGAFYIYADVSHVTEDAGKFCKEMLRETGVAATPGALACPRMCAAPGAARSGDVGTPPAGCSHSARTGLPRMCVSFCRDGLRSSGWAQVRTLYVLRDH